MKKNIIFKKNILPLNYKTHKHTIMKKITLLIGLLYFGLVNAQTPSNNDCSTPTSLQVFPNSCQTPLTDDNTGSSTSSVSGTLCAGANGGDLWYSVTVPNSGGLTVETSGVSGSNIADTGLAVYSGTCGNLSQIGCNDDGPGLGGFSKVELVNLNPGDILLVRAFFIYANVYGQFNICAYDPQAGAITTNNINNFRLSPNPAHKFLNVSADNIINTLEIYNLTGQKVISVKADNTNINIDLSDLQNGIYFVKARIGNETLTYKLIKE